MPMKIKLIFAAGLVILAGQAFLTSQFRPTRTGARVDLAHAAAIAKAAAPGTVIENELDFFAGKPAYYVQVRQGKADIRQIVVDPESGSILSDTINRNDDGEAP